MNRRQVIIGGILLVVLISLGFFVSRVLFVDSKPSEETGTNTPVVDLTYCNENQIKPCIVSFSVDADENMLINILLPDLSFPDFYLKIAKVNGDIVYDCIRTTAAPGSAYCTGEKLPPGDSVHIIILSTKNDALLAEGTLSIIGLAFPTLGVVIPTLAATPTKLTAALPTPTVVLPSSTSVPTQTQSSYPNPSTFYP